MLTKITAYSQWAGVETIVFNVINRPETDLFEVRNIDGLGAVKADVNTTPKGSVDGGSFNGASIGDRNIVLTLGLDPDWDEWTVSRLRRLLDKYFLPKQYVRLVFESMEFSPVGINGYVESNEPNMFSKDPEQQISIICPDLYFKALEATVIEGTTTSGPVYPDYQGNVETGMHVEVVRGADAIDPTSVHIEVSGGSPFFPYGDFIDVLSGSPVVELNKKLVMNSVPGEKYIKKVDQFLNETNLLNYATIINRWPVIGPGTDGFSVTSNAGVQDWTLTYFDLFGSL